MAFNETLTALLPFITFLTVGLIILLLGRLVMGLGRDQRPTDLDRTTRQVFGPLTPALAGIIPESDEKAAGIHRELKRAGYYRAVARQQFLAVRNVLVVGWVLLTAATVVAAYDPYRDPTLQIVMAGAIVALMLYAVPRLYLQTLASRRIQRIQIGLPDGLDMITMCLTGGLPLQQALARVSQEIGTSHADLALELEIIRRHADTYTLEQALVQFAQRIDVPDIKTLAALVTQTERLGTNVAGALRDFADSIRRSHRQRAEEQGNKTSVKLLLPVALCLAPPVYIMLLGPALLELRDFVIRENRPGGILLQAEVMNRERLSNDAADGNR